MKNSRLELRDLPEHVNKTKVNRILTQLDSVAGEVKTQIKKSKTLTQSLKQISSELKSISCANSPKFTEEESYLIGKNRLNKLNKNFLEQKSVESLLRVIDEKQSNTDRLITEEMMKGNSIGKALKARKREFGFRKNESLKFETKEEAFLDFFDEKKAKMLNKILYNNTFRRSFKGQNTIRNEAEPIQTRKMKLKPISLSPTIFREHSPGFQEREMARVYHEAIRKSEIEVGTSKAKLSRLLSLRNIFNLAH